jgi:hypothetical protein
MLGTLSFLLSAARDTALRIVTVPSGDTSSHSYRTGHRCRTCEVKLQFALELRKVNAIIRRLSWPDRCPPEHKVLKERDSRLDLEAVAAPIFRSEAKDCGFTPAALSKTALLPVRLKASDCGFTPAALSKTALLPVRLEAIDCGFTPAALSKTALAPS